MLSQRDQERRRVVKAKGAARAEETASLEVRTAPLCKLLAADLNSAGDHPFSAIGAGRYLPRRIIAVGLTGTAATAVVDVRTATGGGGLAIVAAQSFAALSSDVEVLEITLGALTDALLVSQLYVRVTTPEGGPGTVDLFVFGDVLE